MNFISAYGFTVVGVATSVVLPVLAEAVKRYFPTGRSHGAIDFLPDRILQPFWRAVKPYFILGAFSGVTAFVLVAFAGKGIANWQAAFLLGYACDSTLQRLKSN